MTRSTLCLLVAIVCVQYACAQGGTDVDVTSPIIRQIQDLVAQLPSVQNFQQFLDIVTELIELLSSLGPDMSRIREDLWGLYNYVWGRLAAVVTEELANVNGVVQDLPQLQDLTAVFEGIADRIAPILERLQTVGYPDLPGVANDVAQRIVTVAVDRIRAGIITLW